MFSIKKYIENISNIVLEKENELISLMKNEKDEFAIIKFNNNSKCNAFDAYMMSNFSDIISVLENLRGVKMVILYGQDVFSSGVDVKFVSRNIESRETAYLFSTLMHSNLNRLKALPLIKIAVIEGYALGGGAEIAMACDHILMRSSAKIGFIHIRMGITDGWSGGSRLIHKCGPTIALDIMLSGKTLDAFECLKINLIDEIINDHQFL